MTTIYLVRHAEAQANIDRVFQGCTNGPLSENGKNQLKYLKKRFQKIALEKIYTSPLQRAMETAKAIGSSEDLPIITDNLLVEIDGGLFEGRKFSALPDVFPELWEYWSNAPHLFTAPAGESMRNVYERMKYAITHIAHQNMGMTVAVVSHGCALRNFLCYAADKPFELLDEIPWGDNTCVSKILFDKKFQPHVDYMNDNVHLPEKFSTLAKQTWWQDKSAPKDKEETYIPIKAGELFIENDDLLLSRGSVITQGGAMAVENAQVHIDEGTLYLQDDRIRVVTPADQPPETTVQIEETDEIRKTEKQGKEDRPVPKKQEEKAAPESVQESPKEQSEETPEKEQVEAAT